MILTAPPSKREQKRRKRELKAQAQTKKRNLNPANVKQKRKKHFKDKLKENWIKQSKVFHDCYRPYV